MKILYFFLLKIFSQKILENLAESYSYDDYGSEQAEWCVFFFKKSLKKKHAKDRTSTLREYSIIYLKDEPTLIELLGNEYDEFFLRRILENRFLTNEEALLTFISKRNDGDEMKEIAIRSIKNQEKLLEFVKSTDAFIRGAAIENINDQNVLIDLYETEEHYQNKENIIKKITQQNFLIKVINGSDSNYIKSRAVQNITDQKYLIEVLDNIDSNAEDSYLLEKEIIKNIKNQDMLIKILQSDESEDYIIAAAMENISYKNIEIVNKIALSELKKLTFNNISSELLTVAVRKIKKQKILYKIATNKHLYYEVKDDARKKIINPILRIIIALKKK